MYINKFTYTDDEKQKTVEAFMKNGVLQSLPSKEKRKVIIFFELIKLFEKGKMYTEKQVNEIIKGIYPDFAIIRRYLVDYKLLERNDDCQYYWVNNSIDVEQ
ncbi:DUF2087 domain-containing protein [Sutcliffiella cohnii]